MQAGKLKNKITLELNSPSEGQHGENVDSWATAFTRHAAIIPVGGTERKSGNVIVSESTHKFIIRYANINTKHRIKYGSRYFDINQILNINEKNETQIIMAKEKN